MFEVNGNRGGKWNWAPRQRLTAEQVTAAGADAQALVKLNILNDLSPAAAPKVAKQSEGSTDEESKPAESDKAKRAGNAITGVNAG